MNWGQRHGFDKQQLIATGLLKEKEEEGTRENRCYDRFRHRIMFPIHNDIGRVIGFSGRILDADAKAAKYINTPETEVFHKSRVLYGLHLARQSFRQMNAAIVCEGQLDVIACHRAGLTNAIAPQGTAFTEEQARILKRYTDTVMFAFDADSAGQKAALRSIHIALASDLKPRVVKMPADEDPDGILQDQGPEALKQTLDNDIDPFEFIIHTFAGDDPELKDWEKRQSVAEKLTEALAQIKDPLARSTRTLWVSKRLELPVDALTESVERLLSAEPKAAPKETSQADQQTTQDNNAKPWYWEKDKRKRQGSSKRYRGKKKWQKKWNQDPYDFDEEWKLRMKNEGQVQESLRRPEAVLFDLVLNQQRAAYFVVERLEVELLNDTPLKQAINLVLAMTAEGRWQEAQGQLMLHQELVSAPEISEVLASPTFAFDLETMEHHEKKFAIERLQKAANDCLVCLERTAIEQRIERVNNKLADPSLSNEEKLKLLTEFQDLQKKRTQAQQHQIDYSSGML
jgi:DNA primase